MSRNRLLGAVGVTMLVMMLAGCGRQVDKGDGLAVEIDGSSTVYPVSMAVAEEFRKAHPTVNVSVGFSGTGGGFKKFYTGQIDISDASRPIKPKEAASCAATGIEYIELPIAYDGISVVVNPANDWCDDLSIAELHAIFAPDSTLSNWSQVRDGFPDVALTLYAPGRDSGTFDYFTKKVNGKEGSGRAQGVTASEDDNTLVTGIGRQQKTPGDKGALGYFGYAYYEENKDKLKLLGISYQGADPILPSHQTIVSGSYTPFSRPIFIYINIASLENNSAVSDFVSFYLNEVASLVNDVGYMPLPAPVYDQSRKRLTDRITGSAYADKDAVKGMTLEQIYSR